MYTSSSTPIARMFIRVVRRNFYDGTDGCRACGFIHSLDCRRARRRTDSRDAPSATIDIVRIERLERVSFSLSLSRRPPLAIGIHSRPVANERTNERTDERTTERSDAAARRDARETDNDRRVRSHPIARAREEVRASVSNARRIERIRIALHFKPPTGDDRGK